MYNLGIDKSTLAARRGRRARGLTEAAQPPKPKAKCSTIAPLSQVSRNLAVAILAAIAGACDVRQPLAPVPSPELDQVRSALVDPVGEFSASGFLTTPGTTTLSAGSMGWTNLGISFSKDMWVRVRTSGTVTYKVNPAAQFTPCGLDCTAIKPMFGLEGEAGGAGIGNTLKLRVSMSVGMPGIGYSERLSRAYGGNQLEWVVPVKAGWDLRANRFGIPGGPSCTNCDPSYPFVGWYLLSGGTTFQVEEVIPVQVAPRKLEVARGDSVTFDALAIEGTTNLRWYLSDLRMAGRVRACDTQVTCTVALQKDGFMYVSGDYAGVTSFEGRSEIVRVVDAKLTMECTPNSVTRGAEDVTCTAEAAGDPKFVVTDWTFVSEDGSEQVTPTDPAQASSRTWIGPMVRSGTVTVSARVAGQLQTASSHVTVTNRNWTNRTPHYTFVQSAGDSRMIIPDQVIWSEDLGFASWFDTESPAAPVPDYTAEVRTGPNEGLDYFGEETTVRFFGYYVLNRAAMARGSRFYLAQERGSGGTRIGGMNWCPPSVVATALSGLVENHERMHGSAYEAALGPQFPSVVSELEQITASDPGILYDAYDSAWDRLDRIARAQSLAIHTKPGGLVNPSYQGSACGLKNERGALLSQEP